MEPGEGRPSPSRAAPLASTNNQTGSVDGCAVGNAEARSRVERFGVGPRGAAAVAAPLHLRDDDRAQGARAPARAVRHHARALRPDGAARARAEGPADERSLARADGDG